MKEKSFKVYIIRLLKAIHPGIRLNKSAAEAIDSIIRVIADRIIDRTLVLTHNEDKKTISEREILTATQMIFPIDFANSIVKFANQACDKYSSERESVEKAQTRESRCGLVFSVSAAEKYVRRFGQVGLNVSASSPVFLAAVLEYFTSRLIRETGNVTQTAKKVTICVRHLFLATTNDQSLTFVNNLGIVFLEGGVQPQLLQNKKHKRIKREKKEETKGHRWRPGTKTIMEIRRLQKNGDTLMQRTPFNNIVRELVSKYEQSKENEFKIRLTSDFCTTLHAFTEDNMINLMRRANRIAIHSGRETVYDRDIRLACELAGETVGEQTIKTTIPESALRQMALRAGIQRFGDCSTQTYRNYLVNMLDTYLHDIILCAHYHKLQTLNTKLLLEAFGMRGIYPSIIAHKRKVVGKKSSKTEEEAEEELEDESAKLSDVEEVNEN